MDFIAKLVDGGGTLALAVLVWLELRRVRECLDRTLSALAVEQRVVSHRIKDDHRAILKQLETIGNNAGGR